MSTNTKSVPLLRQSLVAAGVGLSLMEHGLVFGHILMCSTQLREEPNMNIDDDMQSWIVSVCGFSYIPGALICQFVMGRYGRRKANLVSAILIILGWICMLSAPNANIIFVSRVIQGTALGFSNVTSPILVGEYTTPKYRGAFCTMLMILLLFGDFVVHSVASIIPWRETAVFCLIIAVLDAIIIIKSPETPVFLACQGKYDECRNVFHWLRGDNEEEELIDMINAAMLKNDANYKLQRKNTGISSRLKMKTIYYIKALMKPEFYKPILLMMHVNIIQIWCGHVLIDIYGLNVFHGIVGDDTDVAVYIIAMDVLKLLSLSSAVFTITKIRRRTMLILLIGLNVSAYILLGGYFYATEKKLILEHSILGISLVYLLVCSTTAGALPLGCTISGEIFPLEYKEFSAMFSTFAISIHIGIVLKSAPYMFLKMGLHGTFFFNAGLLAYALLVTSIMLPETKDKTLQCIEEEYWTKQQICDREISLVTENDNVSTPIIKLQSNNDKVT